MMTFVMMTTSLLRPRRSLCRPLDQPDHPMPTEHHDTNGSGDRRRHGQRCFWTQIERHRNTPHFLM